MDVPNEFGVPFFLGYFNFGQAKNKHLAAGRPRHPVPQDEKKKKPYPSPLLKTIEDIL
jgi:hypothetical protein